MKFAHCVPFIARLFLCLAAVCLALAMAGLPAGAAPVRMIYDTDMQTDCDDAGALAVLHALADKGEVEILATMICVLNPWAAPCTDAINTFYGRPNIPIGQLKGSDGVNISSLFAQGVAQQFPQDTGSGANAPDATTVYRQILAAEADQSVVILSVGYMTNLAKLLNSPADAISPLTGAQLIQQKVKMWICMGGNFPDDYLMTGGSDNVNFRRHPASVIDCVTNWPGPVEFVGREIGHAMRAGARLTQTPATNPVRRAYELYFGGTAQDRHCADIAAVLYGVRGLAYAGSTYWGIQQAGSMQFTNAEAWFQWVAAPDKNQAYILQSMSPTTIQELLEDLMIVPPGSGSPTALSVSGNGTTITNGDAAPSSADHTKFGATDVDAGTVTRVFTIHNIGTEELTVGEVTIGGTEAADFSVASQPVSPVAPGAAATFSVTFNPGTTGLRAATVSFATNVLGAETFTFAIDGTGGLGFAAAPLTSDADTLALFHFDEASGAFVNAQGNTALDLTNTGGGAGRDNSAANGGGYGAAAVEGFGSAFAVLASGNGTYHTTTSAVGGGATTTGDVLQSALQGASGAFTYEAMVRLPNASSEQTILSHDGGTTRGFLLRVINAELSFYNGTASTVAALPAGGEHAFAASEWFHVAVTYSGEAGAADNLKFYWTALSSTASSANLIGTGTLSADLPGSANNLLGVGTTTRSPFRFEAGFVDEVRISSVAREADEFIFNVPPLTPLQSWRLQHFGTTSPTGIAADDEDPDGDGLANSGEFHAGTVPTDPSSSLRIGAVERSGNDVIVEFLSVAGKMYQLERSLTLGTGTWEALVEDIPGTGGVVTVTHTGGGADAKSFYRVAVMP